MSLQLRFKSVFLTNWTSYFHEGIVKSIKIDYPTPSQENLDFFSCLEIFYPFL